MLSNSNYPLKSRIPKGFSLVEVLATVAIASISLAITVPNFVTFINRQRLNNSRQEMYQAIRSTQKEAMRRKEIWQVSFWQTADGKTYWAKHNQNTPFTSAQANYLGDNVEIDLMGSSYWALDMSAYSSEGVFLWGFKFDDDGHFVESSGYPIADVGAYKMSLKLSNEVDSSDYARGCVFIETLIGGMRSGKNEQCQ